MGVRTEGSAMGKRPAYNHPDFLNDCRQFLVNQINIQRPKIILALGLHILKALSKIAPALNSLKKINSFKELDSKNLSVFSNFDFKDIRNFKTNLVMITHPTYYHLNVKHRKLGELISISAEKA